MNKKYTYFIFSDAHGEYNALLASLAAQGFDESNPNHILISLGDNFDRGTENVEIYKFLEKQNVLCAKGNHDEMLENFLYFKDVSFDIINNGLDRTIVDFAGLFTNTTRAKVRKQMHHLAFKVNERYPNLKNRISQMPAGYKIDNYILNHGGFSNHSGIDHYEDKRWFPDNWAITPRFLQNYYPYSENFKFVFGHWHTYRLEQTFKGVSGISGNKIFRWEGFIGIDIIANLNKQVGILKIESNSEPIPFTEKDSLKEIKKM